MNSRFNEVESEFYQFLTGAGGVNEHSRTNWLAGKKTGCDAEAATGEGGNEATNPAAQSDEEAEREDKKEFMLLLATFMWLTIEWPTYALPAVHPVLPPVANADTETVTNVAFTAREQGLREFRFDLEFTGTASNNVEMAFGTDADGNGELSDSEVAVLAGWDCGELFIANNATDERFAEASADGAHVFSCVCEMRSNGRVVNVACSNDSSTVFLNLASAKPAWLHSLDWNMVRLTGRGENVRVGERFSSKITSYGFFLRLR